jgi:hypothetical protein
MHLVVHWPIHPFIASFIGFLIHWLIRSFIGTSVHSFAHSLLSSVIPLFFPSPFILSFLHSFNGSSFVHSSSFHLISFDFIRCHLISYDFIWFHVISCRFRCHFHVNFHDHVHPISCLLSLCFVSLSCQHVSFFKFSHSCFYFIQWAIQSIIHSVMCASLFSFHFIGAPATMCFVGD